MNNKPEYIVLVGRDKEIGFYLFEDAVKEFAEGDGFFKYIPTIDDYVDITYEMTYYQPLDDSD